MSHRQELTIEQFGKLEPRLPGRIGSHSGLARGNHNFLNAVIYLAKTGIPWRDMPARFGK